MTDTKIEWADKVWNPVVGCEVTSPGCKNCYAMRMACRLSHNPATPQYHGTVMMVKFKPVWTGKIGVASEKKLLEPLKWKSGTVCFVNSMGDLFHPNVPVELIDRTFAVMALSPKVTFKVLTKHAARMREYMEIFHTEGYRLISAMDLIGHRTGTLWPLPNVHLGVSVEDQTRADEHIPQLLATPAAVRFISAEPLLGPIDLRAVRWGHMPATARLDQVIVGGESGVGARPMHPDWARSLRDQSEAAGVPFHFKQWGAWAPYNLGKDDPYIFATPKALDTPLQHVGKKTAGRLLDGREWNGVPE